MIELLFFVILGLISALLLLGCWFMLEKILGVKIKLLERVRNMKKKSDGPNHSGADTNQPAVTEKFNLALWIRVAVMSLIVLLMTIPVDMVGRLVAERNGRYNEAVNRIATDWGSASPLTPQGPFLLIPYQIRTVSTVRVKRADDTYSDETQVTITDKMAMALPKNLKIAGNLDTLEKRISIYKALLYNADLSFSGSFEKPDLNQLAPNVHTVFWDKARLVLALNDTASVRKISPLNIGGRVVRFTPGSREVSPFPKGFTASVDLEQIKEPFRFSFSLGVAGSSYLDLTPVGEENEFQISSNWPHPSFSGKGLPERHDIDPENGFTANWQVPNLVRNYPQLMNVPVNFSADQGQSKQIHQAINEYWLRTSLAEPVSHYSQITRSVKYSSLFIILTFLMFFMCEITLPSGRHRLHALQYGLIGLALSVFYLILLALSEHLGFGPAYGCAAAIAIIMIGVYTRAALGRNREPLIIVLLLAALYGCMFLVLKMEEHALLAGAGLVLLALAGGMYVTRNLGEPKSASQ